MRNFNLVLSVMGAMTLISFESLAVNINAIRNKVCEKPNGYVEIKPGNSDVADQVAQINDERKEAYETEASRLGVSADQVARAAGAKLVKKNTSGC